MSSPLFEVLSRYLAGKLSISKDEVKCYELLDRVQCFAKAKSYRDSAGGWLDVLYADGIKIPVKVMYERKGGETVFTLEVRK